MWTLTSHFKNFWSIVHLSKCLKKIEKKNWNLWLVRDLKESEKYFHEFKQFLKAQIYWMTKFRVFKMVKLTVFALAESTKLISHKIWQAQCGKFITFLSLLQELNFDFYEFLHFLMAKMQKNGILKLISPKWIWEKNHEISTLWFEKNSNFILTKNDLT